MNISVIGDGGWGTTLAILLSNKGFKVSLWGAFPDYISYLRKKRINTKFLPGVKIPQDIEFVENLNEAVSGKRLIILALPSQYLRATLKKIKHIENFCDAIYLSVVKGIEVATLKRMSEVINEELGNVRLAVLSGPTIAPEVAKGIPSAAVVACGDLSIRRYVQGVFMNERFRIYTSADVIGVELGGSLKNVIAIACGISDGLGFGANTKAALLARGLAEISRLGTAIGAKTATFSGISGLGDLVTTCISPYSRNRYVGEQLGRGESLKEIQIKMQMVAEGILTAKSTFQLSRKYGIEMPIAKEVYNVLYRRKPALKAVGDLMTRQRKEE